MKDKLKKSGLSPSGGKQQRLCIARAIAMDPQEELTRQYVAGEFS